MIYESCVYITIVGVARNIHGLTTFQDPCSQLYILPSQHLLIYGRSATDDGCVLRLLARGEAIETTAAEHRCAKGDLFKICNLTARASN